MKFECQHCHQHLESGNSLTGQTIRCPACGKDLTWLWFTPKSIVTGIDVVRGITNLGTIGPEEVANRYWPAAEFWKRYDAGEFK